MALRNGCAALGLAALVGLGCGRTEVQDPFASKDTPGTPDFPVLDLGLPDAPPARVVQLAAGGRHTCAVLDDQQLVCWGANEFGQLGLSNGSRVGPTLVSRFRSVDAVYAGTAHTCVRGDGWGGPGRLQCFGLNYDGQIGAGTRTPLDAPVLVAGIEGAVGVALDTDHTCARQADGTVLCWGENDDGELGVGDTAGRLHPTAVVLDFDEIALGDGFSCGRRGAQAYCWGRDVEGQLGDGSWHSRAFPQRVSQIDRVAHLAAGARHACALLDDGSAWCWGANDHGQLGAGNTDVQLNPVAVLGLRGAVAIGAGGDHTCAITGDGIVRCWGENFNGQTGDGGHLDRSAPTTAVGVDRVIAVAVGGTHTCVLREDGGVLCWGDNGSGQVGGGGGVEQIQPIAVAIPTR